MSQLVWMAPPPPVPPPAPPAPPPPAAPVPAPVPVPVPPPPPSPTPSPPVPPPISKVKVWKATCPIGTVPEFFETVAGQRPAAICLSSPGNQFAGWATMIQIEV